MPQYNHISYNCNIQCLRTKVTINEKLKILKWEKQKPKSFWSQILLGQKRREGGEESKGEEGRKEEEGEGGEDQNQVWNPLFLGFWYEFPWRIDAPLV